ncbi:MAG: hypothetical protein OEL55_03130, partial [Desulfobulbaceae bacterium]|nr:hypothetical protein [Desulfobulbaceae bacterium]
MTETRPPYRLLNLLLTCTVITTLLLAPAMGHAAKKSASDRLLAKRYNMARANFHNQTDCNNKLTSTKGIPELIKQFQEIYDINPDHQYALTCLFMLGYLHEEKGDLADNPIDRAMAITYYRDLAKRFPRHTLAD